MFGSVLWGLAVAVAFTCTLIAASAAHAGHFTIGTADAKTVWAFYDGGNT